MTDESAQTIVTLLMRIEARLDAIEKRLDAGQATTGRAPGGVDRRAAQQPIDHEDRRKLSGEL